jgi:phage shock protein C
MSRFENRFSHGHHRSRNGVILGVCRGLAEYSDISLFWIRFIGVVLLLFTGIWPIVILYVIAALFMNPEPTFLEDMDQREFYDGLVRSREMTTDRIKRRHEELERRIQRLEHTVTTPEFDWERRLNSEPR